MIEFLTSFAKAELVFWRDMTRPEERREYNPYLSLGLVITPIVTGLVMALNWSQGGPLSWACVSVFVALLHLGFTRQEVREVARSKKLLPQKFRYIGRAMLIPQYLMHLGDSSQSACFNSAFPHQTQKGIIDKQSVVYKRLGDDNLPGITMVTCPNWGRQRRVTVSAQFVENNKAMFTPSP